MSKLIYLASPYSHPDATVQAQRFDDVVRVSAKLMCEGHFIFSPIAHAHPMAVAHELPGHWEFWKELDELLVTRCDEVWVLMLDGWEDSRGVKAEVALAQSQGKRVCYLHTNGNLEWKELHA